MGITALFGGTFNPPHIGHYEILKALEKNPDIEETMIIPDRIPPHKVCDFLATNEDRINMCKLISEDFTKASLCLMEFEREGKSYSIDTVRLLKKKHPDKSFAFVCGGDMLISFDKWHKYDELIKEIPFIVFRRKGCDGAEFDRRAEHFKMLGMRLTVPDSVIPAVSSTEIRNSADKAREYLPEKVYEYIINGGFYNGIR